MLDGGALPAWFSRTAAEAARASAGWPRRSRSARRFGGDLEAVTLHSGLLAARHVLGASMVVVAQGPGNLGTGTRWGFSGVAAARPSTPPPCWAASRWPRSRISDADPRERHRGISHHSLTAYGRVALARADVVVPDLPGDFGAQVRGRSRAARLPAQPGQGRRRRPARDPRRVPRAALDDGPRSRG